MGALSLAEMVHHREHTPRAINTPSPNGAPIIIASISSFPVRREHILCDWKAPRLEQEIEEISDVIRAVIEDVWPELVHKPAGYCQGVSNSQGFRPLLGPLTRAELTPAMSDAGW
jgi:hypothetical protein